MRGLEPQTIESLNLLKRRNTEFIVALNKVITQLKEQGLNTKLYYRNKEMGETYSTVPTCAISGEGIPDLLLLLVQWTQETMIEKLTHSNEVQGTYLHHKESRLPRLARLLHRALSMRLQALLYMWWGLMMIWRISRKRPWKI
ncbi:Eukaryotic translation initiation factor 5B [Camellia lanceoleosa]|uniref:Eukaryotic translation initiation factor 5B n=1 Tax=Camellia lanceoleosa TaxID=1840588 RepID=A0ACC0GRY9_9ERIC|nr:Eukaryotic translation initiation factor 5B [Camellia lanceoleosa]